MTATPHIQILLTLLHTTLLYGYEFVCGMIVWMAGYELEDPGSNLYPDIKLIRMTFDESA